MLQIEGVRARLATAALAAVALSGWSTAAVQAQTTVNVSYLWFDRGGAASHPLKGLNVEVYDDDSPLPPDFFGTFTTDANGLASASGNITDPGADDTLEVYTNVRMEITGVASVKTNFADADPLKLRLPTGNGFFLANEGQGAPPNTFGPASVANTDYTIRAMPVLQIVQFMNAYYKAAPFNANLPAITIRVNNGAATNMGGSQMNLGNNDWSDTDIIMHEYGHHVQEFNNLRDGTLGNDHFFGQDNISAPRNYGTDVGSRLAWQEGTATLLGLMAVQGGNLAGAIPGMPADDYDLAYDEYTNADNQTVIDGNDLQDSFNIESRFQTRATGGTIRQGGSLATTSQRGAGEGDELSVMRAMWDFHDSANENYTSGRNKDYTTYGVSGTYALMNGKGKFYNYWQALNADTRANKAKVGLVNADPDAKAVARLGSTLEEYAISSIPLTFGATADTTPTLEWTEQNNDNSNAWRILIFSSDWTSLIYDSGQQAAGAVGDLAGSLDTLLWTIPDGAALALGSYNYEILNDPAFSTGGELNASMYNWYWSGPADFSVVPEPAMVGLALIAFAPIGMGRRRRKRY
jgi:hypothetical protein